MLRVHNWEKWQSYRSDRSRPPWIKLHRSLMRDPKWIALSDVQRGQLVCLWMLAADDNGQLPDDPVLLQRLCYGEVTIDLNVFIQLGFLDAKMTSSRRQRDVKLTSSRRHRLDKTRGDSEETSKIIKLKERKPDF